MAVVTGGSRGIGAATAAAFAANGVAVTMAGRDEKALAKVTGPIERGGGQAMWVAADCTVASEVDRMTGITLEIVGGRIML